MLVFLQGHAATRLHHDPLGLKPVATVHSLVAAPWPNDARRLVGPRVGARPKLFHDPFHLFGPIERRNESGVLRYDTKDLVEADHRDRHLGLATDQRIVYVEREDIARKDIAVLVRGRKLADGIPAADIGPGEAHGNDLNLVRVLHHRIVDRNRTNRREGFRIGTHERLIDYAVM